MLREIFLKNALQAYIDGEDVQALIRTGDDEYRMVPIETLFGDSRFLIDKKAAKVDPEFEAAVQEMVSQDPPPAVTEGDSPESSGGTEKPAGGRAACSSKRKQVDTGKLLALRKAGWSMKKIADELGISEGSVFNYLKKMEGEADEKDKTVSGSAHRD